MHLDAASAGRRRVAGLWQGSYRAVDDLDLVAREVEDAELVEAREPLDPLHVVAVEVEDVELG